MFLGRALFALVGVDGLLVRCPIGQAFSDWLPVFFSLTQVSKFYLFFTNKNVQKLDIGKSFRSNYKHRVLQQGPFKFTVMKKL